MRIVLLRHGRPEFDFQFHRRVPSRDLGDMLQAYNRAELAVDSQPGIETIRLAQSMGYIVCSHLPRSLESAERLQIEEVHESHEQFRECDVPYFGSQFPKLKVKTWVVMLRVLWYLGMSANGESISKLKQRATRCADVLKDRAQEHESVMLVGHGILNHFIARTLRQQGWHGPVLPNAQHWGVTEYRYTG
jgi:broad specificity phosphatase PhoE